MDGLNEYRRVRVADVLSDFRTLQYYIAAAPTEPENMEDYYAEGWAALRQCSLDGQHILNCAADTSVPQAAGGEEEQEKAELKQILLDSFARRHEGQKIYLRQAAAQRWVDNRNNILQGGRPHSGNQSMVRSCDRQLRAELATITDEAIYTELRASDQAMGRWTAEDPSLRGVQRWLRARR
ncbi:conserved hypothetical protein [Verticillium alfalfae VaMs.102]|uniref:Uncharacterized protein n=1 Tax=Verticillium alfalfae (strain VaMs.102 / ATCC MYA-4576 / FGSC 10136) TaxID=526221 RepID=C9S684_VERA1|nr:conserved hypothetical protein [Verticillium alfalfae VaMs.102]EEY14396.1 conserved hypothetical protein [Verticillium alfalfae VaMs.102]